MKHKNGFVICVDTWAGDVNMRLAPEFQNYMQLKNGMPTLYHKFLARMKQHQLIDMVFPLVLPSIVASRFLSYVNWKFDVIYLDSAHELGETLVELILYYQLLRPGGIMFGDDTDWFPAVKHDVEMFAKYKGVELVMLTDVPGGQWLIQKPME